MSLGRLLLGVCLLSAFALTGRALLGAPPPVWLAGAVLTALLATLFLGALAPCLDMYGAALCRGPREGKLVALTFDDGPSSASTPAVLDTLQARGARATFFVIGRRATEEPALIQRMVREGHAVGLHGMDHHRAYAFLSPKAVEDDLVQCARAVTAAGAPQPLWFRPPVGQASPRTFAGARRAGVEIVAWTFRGRDGWRSTKAEQLLVRLERALVPGAIVLLHDAWERPKAEDPAPPLGARLLPQILDLCAQKGLTPVTLDELVQAGTAGKSTTKRAPEA